MNIERAKGKRWVFVLLACIVPLLGILGLFNGTIKASAAGGTGSEEFQNMTAEELQVDFARKFAAIPKGDISKIYVIDNVSAEPTVIDFDFCNVGMDLESGCYRGAWDSLTFVNDYNDLCFDTKNCYTYESTYYPERELDGMIIPETPSETLSISCVTNAAYGEPNPTGISTLNLFMQNFASTKKIVNGQPKYTRFPLNEARFLYSNRNVKDSGTMWSNSLYYYTAAPHRGLRVNSIRSSLGTGFPMCPDHRQATLDTGFSNGATYNTTRVYYIEYSAAMYDVTFKYYDSNLQETIKTERYLRGADIVEPNIPKKFEHMTFKGWNIPIETAYQNLTFTALYEKDQFTITYYDIYDAVHHISSVYYNDYINVSGLADIVDKNTGKMLKFRGWSTKKGDTTKIIAVNGYRAASDLSLYAIFDEKPIDNGGSDTDSGGTSIGGIFGWIASSWEMVGNVNILGFPLGTLLQIFIVIALIPLALFLLKICARIVKGIVSFFTHTFKTVSKFNKERKENKAVKQKQKQINLDRKNKETAKINKNKKKKSLKLHRGANNKKNKKRR